jgi:hypothetical protein
MWRTNNMNKNRKAYQTPKLTCYEDVRTITLGSSPIGEESGPGGVDFRIPGGNITGASPQRSEQAESDIFEG